MTEMYEHASYPQSTDDMDSGSETSNRLPRFQMALAKARELYEEGLDWRAFNREVLGANGLVRQMLPDEEYEAFENTPEFAKIHELMSKLREKSEKKKESEPVRVITVRLPQSVHETLRAEAHGFNTSMNQLCIAKLVRMIDEEEVKTKKSAKSK